MCVCFSAIYEVINRENQGKTVSVDVFSSSGFSWNSEVSASKLIENLEEMYLVRASWTNMNVVNRMSVYEIL